MMRRIRNFGRKGEMAFSTFLGFMGGKPFLNKNAQKHENHLFAFFVLILTWFYLPACPIGDVTPNVIPPFVNQT